jgi:hypothetical protein
VKKVDEKKPEPKTASGKPNPFAKKPDDKKPDDKKPDDKKQAPSVKEPAKEPAKNAKKESVKEPEPVGLPGLEALEPISFDMSEFEKEMNAPVDVSAFALDFGDLTAQFNAFSSLDVDNGEPNFVLDQSPKPEKGKEPETPAIDFSMLRFFPLITCFFIADAFLMLLSL